MQSACGRPKAMVAGGVHVWILAFCMGGTAMAKEESIVESLLVYSTCTVVSNSAYIGIMGGVHRSTATLQLLSLAAISLATTDPCHLMTRISENHHMISWPCDRGLL